MNDESPFKPPINESADHEPKKSNPKDSYAKGIGLGFAAHLFLLVFFLMPDDGIFAILFFGAFQVVYQLPIWLVLRSKGLHRMGSGLWLAAGISFLLNAGVFGLCFAILSAEGF